jgi:hypothetical protein
MAGLETVVRPVVFPVIRPTPKQSAAAKDNPNQGKAVITGSSGKTIDLPYSWSVSSSESRRRETKRRYDQARVYQKDDNGKINKDNFVDVNVANKIWYKDGDIDSKVYYARVKEKDNVEIKKTDQIDQTTGQRNI